MPAPEQQCKQSLPGQEAHVAQVGHGERKVLASQTLLQNAQEMEYVTLQEKSFFG